MGLQYVDGTGTERTLTVADMLTQDFQSAYSDLYKGINGFRPRGHDAETMLRFFDTYEAQFHESEVEEAVALQRRSDRDGIQYTSWSHYYECKDNQAHEEWTKEQALLDAELAHKAEFERRDSPLPVIEAWEHGVL